MFSLQRLHTFRLPCFAKNIQKVTALSEALTLWQQVKERNQPYLILGQGSNVVFLEDFQGTIWLNQLKGITWHHDEQFHYLQVGGGENWHHLVQWCLERNILGLENLALIPGCVGSAPIQNIGAYGMEFSQACDYVEILHLNSGQTQRLSCQDCQFGYRESIFKHALKHEVMIVAVGLKLAKNWQPNLSYAPLATFAQTQLTPITAWDIFHQVCKLRQAKLPDPRQQGNAGSFFKNPLVSRSLGKALALRYPNLPVYDHNDTQVKLAAGWLIDQCGLKGYRIGGAAVHSQQALVLVNQGTASCQDIVNLARFIRTQVEDKFEVSLQPEVRFIRAKGEVDSETVMVGE